MQIVMPRLGWRWLLALSSIPSFLVLLFSTAAPESPRYLFMKGRTDEAHDILKKVAQINGKELPPGILIADHRRAEDEESSPDDETHLLSSTQKKISSFQLLIKTVFELFSRDMLKTTLLLNLLNFGYTFAFYGVVLMISAVSSEQHDCGQLTLSSGNVAQDTSLYRNVLITSSAGNITSRRVTGAPI